MADKQIDADTFIKKTFIVTMITTALYVGAVFVFIL